jgi:hypothetical protein
MAKGIPCWEKNEMLFEDHSAPDQQEIGHGKPHGETKHALSLGGGWSAWGGYGTFPLSRTRGRGLDADHLLQHTGIRETGSRDTRPLELWRVV